MYRCWDYTAELREGGVLHGEGQGIITTKDGKEMVTWAGQGIGRLQVQER